MEDDPTKLLKLSFSAMVGKGDVLAVADIDTKGLLDDGDKEDP